MSLEPLHPQPGYSSLRRYRWSAVGAEYFATFKLARPTVGLTAPPLLRELDHHRERLESESIWSVRTCVVMPDHVHVLFALGPTATLEACVRLFKGRLSPTLRNHQLTWQDGYFEHRMRADEDRLPVFLYIFLNPYRANLLPPSEIWPGYFCAPVDWSWFAPLSNADKPFPAWLSDR